MRNRNRKVLSCVFFDDVLCSFRKTEHFAIMERCLRCPHLARFEREMDEEDEQEMAEIDKIRKYGYPRRFDVPKGGF